MIRNRWKLVSIPTHTQATHYIRTKTERCPVTTQFICQSLNELIVHMNYIKDDTCLRYELPDKIIT